MPQIGHMSNYASNDYSYDDACDRDFEDRQELLAAEADEYDACDHDSDPIYWVGPSNPYDDWQAYCSACDDAVDGREDEYDGAPCCRAQVTAGRDSGEHEPGCGG